MLSPTRSGALLRRLAARARQSRSRARAEDRTHLDQAPNRGLTSRSRPRRGPRRARSLRPEPRAERVAQNYKRPLRGQTRRLRRGPPRSHKLLLNQHEVAPFPAEAPDLWHSGNFGKPGSHVKSNRAIVGCVDSSNQDVGAAVSQCLFHCAKEQAAHSAVASITMDVDRALNRRGVALPRSKRTGRDESENLVLLGYENRVVGGPFRPWQGYAKTVEHSI